jgi:hypothetical protein
MTIKLYPARNEGLEFHMCICTHGQEGHREHGFWSSNYEECEKCECPKYERDPDTRGLYEECKENENPTMSKTNQWSGCKRFYKRQT